MFVTYIECVDPWHISVWNLFDLVICDIDHEQFLTSVQPHPAARSGLQTERTMSCVCVIVVD